MHRTITQKIKFKNIDAGTLYEMFLDTSHHIALTGGVSAKLSDQEGETFSAHGDYITGRNLQLIPHKLIVQSWRGSDWDEKDVDSTFILFFEQNGKDAIINMTHANLPGEHADGIKQGWTDYYWRPWKKYVSEIK